MITFPNCKINLGLYITRKRDDGYHDLETVFYPVKGLSDALEIVPAKGGETSMRLSGRAVAGDPESNLVWKACHLLRDAFPDKVPLLDIYLHKVIPMGAGLGGGSADGAAMLGLLNEFAGLELRDEALADLALRLGSDCPFFIYNTPQYATGRGEIMVPAAIDLSGYSMQLICPETPVGTGKAFSLIKPKPAAFDLKHLAGLPVPEWKDRVGNDFEEPVFAMHPELARIKEQLYGGGAVYASLSGSGSTVYGIFEQGKRTEVEVEVAFDQFYLE